MSCSSVSLLEAAAAPFSVSCPASRKKTGIEDLAVVVEGFRGQLPAGGSLFALLVPRERCDAQPDYLVDTGGENQCESDD
ncbi:MAG: hypothetical protein AB2L13_20415 [Spirochaetota bacterium]